MTKPLGQKSCGNGVVVVAQVLVVGGLDWTVRLFELGEDQWDAVDEEDRVGPAAMKVSGDPYL